MEKFEHTFAKSVLSSKVNLKKTINEYTVKEAEKRVKEKRADQWRQGFFLILSVMIGSLLTLLVQYLFK